MYRGDLQMVTVQGKLPVCYLSYPTGCRVPLHPTKPEEEEVWDTLNIIRSGWTHGEVGEGSTSFSDFEGERGQETMFSSASDVSSSPPTPTADPARSQKSRESSV